MGFIRGGLILILSIVALGFLLLLGLSFVISSSLSYDNVNKVLTPIVVGMINQKVNLNQTISSNYIFIQKQCENNTEFVYSDPANSDLVLVVPCEVVKKGPDEFVRHGLEYVINQTYYKEYNCKFFNCFKETSFNGLPVFLVSKHTKDYFNNRLYVSFIVLAILFVAILFISEKKGGCLKIFGVLFLIASLPFVLVSKFGDWFNLGEFVSLFISNSYFIFGIFLFLGIVFIGLGIGLNISEWKIWKSKEEKK
jgi:hypothetical protein